MYKELMDLLLGMEDSPARKKLAEILVKYMGENPPYKISYTGDDVTKYVTYGSDKTSDIGALNDNL